MMNELQELLCEQWCSGLEIAQDTVGMRLSLPLLEADGDCVTVWVKKTVGGWQLRDCGTTFMRLSYDIDTDLLADGQRSRVLERILAEHQVQIVEGELTAIAEERDLGATLLRFGQAMLRIGDIKLWSRARIANTFYEDLRATLSDIVGVENLLFDYEAPGVPDASSYRIDYAVKGAGLPLYIFGVPSSDKAKLATIILLHLQQAGHAFESLIIPSDLESIAKPDLRRLVNAADAIVDSSQSRDAIRRKVLHRAG